MSDLSAARCAHLLFVKIKENHTNDLWKHCVRENLPFVQFTQFAEVKAAVEAVVTGSKTIEELLAVEKSAVVSV